MGPEVYIDLLLGIRRCQEKSPSHLRAPASPFFLSTEDFHVYVRLLLDRLDYSPSRRECPQPLRL